MEQSPNDKSHHFNTNTPELQRWRLAQAGRIVARLAAALDQKNEQNLDESTLSVLADKIMALVADEEVVPFLGETMPKNVTELSIDDLVDNFGLSMRLRNSLIRSGGFHSVSDLLQSSCRELRDCRGIGEHGVTELKLRLEMLGLSPREE